MQRHEGRKEIKEHLQVCHSGFAQYDPEAQMHQDTPLNKLRDLRVLASLR